MMVWIRAGSGTIPGSEGWIVSAMAANSLSAALRGRRRERAWMLHFDQRVTPLVADPGGNMVEINSAAAAR